MGIITEIMGFLAQKEMLSHQREIWGLEKEQKDLALKHQKMINDAVEKSYSAGIIDENQVASILGDPKGPVATVWGMGLFQKSNQPKFVPESTPEPYETPTEKYLKQEIPANQPSLTGQIAKEQLGFGGMNPQDMAMDILKKQTGIGESIEPVRTQEIYNSKSGKMEMAQILRNGTVRFLGYEMPTEVTRERVAGGATGVTNMPVPKLVLPGQQGINFPEPVKKEFINIKTPNGIFTVPVNPYMESGGTGVLQTEPAEKDMPIKTDDLPNYVHTQTLESPPPGLTPAQAEKQGYKRLTTNAKTQVDSMKGMNEVLSKLGTLMTDVFPKKGGVGERIMGGTLRLGGALSQANPKATELSSFINGTLAPIIRSLGEKGTLADTDVKRAIALMPSLTDSADVAWGKYRNVIELFGNIQKSVVKGQYKPIPSKSKQPKYSTMTDEELLKQLGK